MNFALLFLLPVVVAQSDMARPVFADYRVRKVYQGKPAAPVLGGWRDYRTMIRKGAKSPVQFAGHYTVPMWGCGAGCSVAVIVDSISGKIFEVPFTVVELPIAWAKDHPDQERIEFHPDSRLMKINGCPNETNCGFYDYVMEEGKGLKLVRRELLPKELH